MEEETHQDLSKFLLRVSRPCQVAKNEKRHGKTIVVVQFHFRSGCANVYHVI